MTATGHAAIAALIAARFGNPYIALPLSFASHIVCDILPHWDSGTHYRKKTKKRLFFEVVFDVVLSLIVAFIIYVYFLKQTDLVFLYLNVFWAQLLDWLSVPTIIFKRMRLPILVAIDNFQSKIHNRLDKPWGIWTQVVAVVVLYVILFKILP